MYRQISIRIFPLSTYRRWKSLSKAERKGESRVPEVGRSMLWNLSYIFQIWFMYVLTDRLGGKEAWRPTHFSWYYQAFFCIFQTNVAMATLGLKEMGKFLWEGREKVLPSWLSQFSFAKQSRPFPLPKMQKKYGIIKSGLDAMPYFPPRRSFKGNVQFIPKVLISSVNYCGFHLQLF